MHLKDQQFLQFYLILSCFNILFNKTSINSVLACFEKLKTRNLWVCFTGPRSHESTKVSRRDYRLVYSASYNSFSKYL